MLPSGARKWTQALPLSSTPDSKRISAPADRNSAVASWTLSTRNPATGPVVKWRLMGLSGPKTSTLLPSESLSIQNPGWSSSSPRPRTSRKNATVGSALSVRVPTQASLLIRIPGPIPEVGLVKRSAGSRHDRRRDAGADRRLSLFGGLVGTEVSVRDGTAVGPESTDVLVRGPLGLHGPDRGPWGRAGRRPGRRVLC